MLSRANLLLGHGFSVLLIDLQGHGETPGAAITLGSRESADVGAALGWLKRTAPSRRIGVIGCSLGGAAVLLGPQPSGLDAVVLEAVYPRVTDAVENRIRIRVGPLAPVVLVVAGSRDQHTTLAESEALFAAAIQPKRLWVVSGARHQDA